MALKLKHKAWKKAGREMEVLDDLNQPTGRKIWRGKLGEQSIHDGADYQPYIWDAGSNELRYASNDLRIGLESGQQTLKKAGQALCSSMKLFVQRETSPGVWQNEPHGLPTRQLRHNKRFVNGVLTDEEGYAIGWLEFPDAAYDLQIGLQAGRAANATMGFRFRAPISARVRLQLVKDGISKIAGDAQGFKLLRARGGLGSGGQERVVGLQYKNFSWRWTWAEAAHRDVAVEDSSDHPGKLKVTITIGPIDYQANTWVQVLPDTWGYTENAGDCYEIEDSTYNTSASYIYVGAYSALVHGGLAWQYVDAEGAVLSSYIRTYGGSFIGGGATDADLRAIDWYPAVESWNSSYLPSSLPKHAASVAWNKTSGTGTATSPDIATLIQARVDDGHDSGVEPILIAWLSNSSTGTNLYQFDSVDGNGGAALTIEYSPAAAHAYETSILGVSTTSDDVSITIVSGLAYETSVAGASATSDDVSATLTRSLTADVLAASATPDDVIGLCGNDFSQDSDAEAVYRFESGALTTDSSGNSNTLTAANTPTADTTNYKRGTASVHYDENDYDRHYIVDSNLSAGFPLKSSGGAATFSLTFWMRPTDHDEIGYIVDKYDTDSARSFALVLDDGSGTSSGTARSLFVFHGYNSGNNFEGLLDTAVSLTLNQWYFIHFTYDASTRTHRLRVWDDTADDWLTGSPFSEVATNAMSLDEADWAIGNRSDGSTSRCYDGNIDELVFWSRILSDTDAEAVRDDLFPSYGVVEYIANVLGASSASDDAVASLSRLLTADVLGASTASDDVPGTLARSLLSDILAASQTSDDVGVGFARSLLTSMLGSSSTADDVAIQTARTLLATILGVSSTSDDVTISMPGILAYMASVLGASATSDDVTAETARLLNADLLGASVASDDVSVEIVRLLTADILAASATSDDASAALTRLLMADILGASSTPEISISVADIILYATSILGASVTADFVAIQTARTLAADIQAASLASDDATMSIARTIVANILAASATSDDVAASVANIIAIAASILATSSTADDVAVTILRQLTADMVAASATSEDVTAALARLLTADILGASLTSDDLTLILAGLGVIVDPTLSSLTVNRAISSLTTDRTIVST